MIGQSIARLDSTTPCLPLCIETNLIGFWSINAGEADFLAANDQRVAVNDARQTGNRLFAMRGADKKSHKNGDDAQLCVERTG